MDEAKAVREHEVLDWENLEIYLRESLPELTGKMMVAQFHGGHANLTYLLRFGDKELVLRRPPFGVIAPGAHDMKREYRVLSKLHQHFSPAPRAYHLCLDEEIIGAMFVVMERRHGVLVRTGLPECFRGTRNVESRLAAAMVKAEADLHIIDVEKAGLTDMGKPEGFVQRQLAGWARRWELSETEQNTSMRFLFKKLSEEIPEPQAVSILHNDLKFDNCQFQPDDPDRVTSIFDWDMSTIGDPLIDFGTTLAYWPDKKKLGFPKLPTMLRGDFPDKSFLIKKYAEHTGFSMDQVSWYEAFSYGKTATIAQQLYKRFVDGDTKDERMAHFGYSAMALSSIAESIAKEL